MYSSYTHDDVKRANAALPLKSNAANNRGNASHFEGTFSEVCAYVQRTELKEEGVKPDHLAAVWRPGARRSTEHVQASLSADVRLTPAVL